MEYNHILIKNIYYMLSYVYDELHYEGIKSIETEDFEDMLNLMAAILENGVAARLKRGLLREYEERTDELSTLRGRISFSDTLRHNTLIKRHMVCTFDEYSENYLMNRILKSTLELLVQSKTVEEKRRGKLKRLLMYFSGIDGVDIKRINWSLLKYHRNNSNYRLLMNICRIIAENMLHTTEDGKTILKAFSHKTLHSLYEKFIFRYFDREKGRLGIAVTHPAIKWNGDYCENTALPTMQTDIVIIQGSKALIIDAKFYSKIMVKSFRSDKMVYHSSNMYQIFTYVKNYSENYPNKDVSGMLLYSKTDENITKAERFMLSENHFSVEILDLNQDFKEIARQLDKIVSENFSV